MFDLSPRGVWLAISGNNLKLVSKGISFYIKTLESGINKRNHHCGGQFVLLNLFIENNQVNIIPNVKRSNSQLKRKFIFNRSLPDIVLLWGGNFGFQSTLQVLHLFIQPKQSFEFDCAFLLQRQEILYACFYPSSITGNFKHYSGILRKEFTFRENPFRIKNFQSCEPIKSFGPRGSKLYRAQRYCSIWTLLPDLQRVL